MLIEIDGLDIKKGISHSGGTINLYLEALSTFFEDANDRTKKVEKCVENEDFIHYTTYVHALKSASANIGASELSHIANALELAGNEGDWSYVRTNNEKFLYDLQYLLKSIKEALSDLM